MQWLDFFGSLKDANGLHVCMGDLFDTNIVSYQTILMAAGSYRAEALKKPGTDFVVLRGNHDASRDADAVSAYGVFAALLADVKNVHVLEDEPLQMEGFLFVPWHPFKSAAEMIPTNGCFRAAFGHWDVIDFGNNNPNLIPVEQLRQVATSAYTGHDHNKRDITLDQFPVHVVGSMQPYSHAEDAEGKLYVTLSADEFGATNPLTLRDKCVRVRVKKGEEIPAEIDCLQFAIQRVDDSADEQQTVELDAFDLRALFMEACTEEGVDEDLTTKLWEQFCSNQ